MDVELAERKGRKKVRLTMLRMKQRRLQAKGSGNWYFDF